MWLKSGGYIIIDQAEALTAIDVNSGRYVGKKNLEETITKINVEAAKEIVYQLRLRNIGGIIIIDFIDMDKPQNRDKVFKALQEALGRDKAKTNVLKISELGPGGDDAQAGARVGHPHDERALQLLRRQGARQVHASRSPTRSSARSGARRRTTTSPCWW